jgi:queuosine precursor transporter
MNDKIYQTLSVVFCMLVVLSNLIATKLIPVPFYPKLALSAGILVYPFTFLISDLVTEVFGAQKARFMVFLGFLMCLMAQGIISAVLLLPTHQISNQSAFEAVFQLGQVALFSSIAAYLVGQVLDIYLFNSIHQWTGDRLLWLRSIVSSLISQAYDTICVTTLFYYFGVHLPTADIAKILVISYLFKAAFTLIMTPLFYQCVRLVKNNQESGIRVAHASP